MKPQIVALAFIVATSSCYVWGDLGDFDGNCNRDLADFAAFSRCLGAVANTTDGEAMNCLAVFDIDHDFIVSLKDYRLLQQVQHGPKPVRSPNTIFLTPVCDQVLVMGDVLDLQVSTSVGAMLDVQPAPLPANSRFDPADGSFRFVPAPNQTGDWLFTFTASLGGKTEEQLMQVTVLPPLPGTKTAIAGVVWGTDDLPIPGVTVTIDSASVGTGPIGSFFLTDFDKYAETILFDGMTAGIAYPSIPEMVDLVLGHPLYPDTVNVVQRPIYLPIIDWASADPIDPASESVVDSAPELGVVMTVPAGSARNPDGSLYSGMMAISSVPPAQAPISLPPELSPAQLISIQPGGLSFIQPAPISFQNVSNLTVGSEVDIYSVDPKSGTFAIVGTGIVPMEDPSIVVTKTGGIVDASWHLMLPPEPLSEKFDNDFEQFPADPPDCAFGSDVTLFNGNLTTEIDLPNYKSLMQQRQVTLVYNSQMAAPFPVIPLVLGVSLRSAVPDRVSYRLSAGGYDQPIVTHLATTGLPEDQDSKRRIAVGFDASEFPTGEALYELAITSSWENNPTTVLDNSSITTFLFDRVTVANESGSYFGAGWSLDGLLRAYKQHTGNVVMTDGRSARVFERPCQAAPRGLVSWLPFNGHTMDIKRNKLGIPSQGNSPTGFPKSCNFRPGLNGLAMFSPNSADTSTLCNPTVPGCGTNCQPPNVMTVGLGNDSIFESSQVTVESWVRFANPPSIGNNTQVICAKKTNAVTQWSLQTVPFINEGERLRFSVNVGNSIYNATDTAPYAPGTWLHVVGTFGREPSGLHFVRLYVNGALRAQTQTDVAGILSQPTLTVRIGGQFYPQSGTVGDWVRGSIDDTRIYDRRLNAGEILSLYQAGANGMCADDVSFTDCEQTPEGLIAAWDFDGSLKEDVNNVLSIACGNGLGNFSAGSVGGAFGPTSNNLESVLVPAPNSAVFDTPQISVEAWVKAQNLTGWQGIVTKRSCCPQTTYQWSLQTQNALAPTRWAFGVRTSAGIHEAISPQGLTNQWTHLVGTYDGDVVRLYVNGVLAASNPAPSGPIIPNTNLPLRIKARTCCDAQDFNLWNSCNSTLDPFPGQVDSVRIYSRALTTSEAAVLYQAGSENKRLCYGQQETSDGFVRYISPNGDFSELVEYPDGTLRRTGKYKTVSNFDAQGRLISDVDRNGNTVTYTYDNVGRLISVTDPVGLETIFAYNGSHLGTITDPAGRTTMFEHDAAGNLSNVNFPDGSMRAFTYDHNHLLIDEIDGRGNMTTHEYDSLNRIVRATLPDGSEQLACNAQSVGYVDPASGMGTEQNPAPWASETESVSRLTDGGGNLLTFITGAIGQIARTIDSAGNETHTTLNNDGLVTTLTEASSHGFSFSYDSLGNNQSIDDLTIGTQHTYVYEPTYNQPVSMTNSFAAVMTSMYDGSGNLTQLTTPEGRITTLSRNPAGLVASATLPNGLQVSYQYDPSTQNLLSITVGTGIEARTRAFTYTPFGALATTTDSLGRTHAVSYDPLGRPVILTFPGGRTAMNAFDANDNLLVYKTPSAAEHVFTYDARDLFNTHLPPPIPGVNSGIMFDYNGAAQPTVMHLPDNRSVSFSYDAAGRLSGIHVARGDYTQTFNPISGLVETAESPDEINLSLSYVGELPVGDTWSGTVGGSVSWTILPEELIGSMSVNGQEIATYDYDDDLLMTAAGATTYVRQANSGLIDQVDTGQIIETLTYNQFAEMTTCQVKHGNTPLYASELSYDKLGRITTKVETVLGETSTFAYIYDAAGRLTQVDWNGVASDTFTYDVNGNRLSHDDSTGPPETATYDVQDRVISYGQATYTHNGLGQPLTRTQAGEVTTFDYDELGALLGVTLSSGTQVTYGYDALDRRVTRSVDGLLESAYLYSGKLKIVAELDGQLNLVSTFVYGDRSEAPEHMLRDGLLYDMVSDERGSVRLVVRADTGEIVQRLDYDVFGRVILDTQPGFQPFGFAAGLIDEVTGLLRFGARDYDPTMGRFLTRDPALLEGGVGSLYEYCHNDPVNLVDSEGRKPRQSLGDFLREQEISFIENHMPDSSIAITSIYALQDPEFHRLTKDADRYSFDIFGTPGYKPFQKRLSRVRDRAWEKFKKDFRCDRVDGTRVNCKLKKTKPCRSTKAPSRVPEQDFEQPGLRLDYARDGSPTLKRNYKN